MASRARLRIVMLAVVAVLGALLAAPAPSATAVDRERVYGAINCPPMKMSKCPSMKVLWFDKNWRYLGTRNANNSSYVLNLAPGTYHLQFVDQRKPYNTDKYAPTDIKVTVRSQPVPANVTMRPGASITGVARAGGKALADARIYAANRAEQSFPTTANDKGQFAIGGLPAGKYCLFTYDRKKQFVDKCTWVGGLDFGQNKNRKVVLKKKAGSLRVFVDTKDDNPAPNSTVTVTSRTTGQWWSAQLRQGEASFRGLHPGRYNIKYDGGGVWFAASGAVRGAIVRASRPAFGNFVVPKRGGWVTGVLVDAGDPNSELRPQGTQPGATVMLFAQDGTKLAETTSNADGRFRLNGQIRTQDGMTIVVDPSSSSSGYMVGADICQFQRTELAHQFRAIQGEESFTGPIQVERVPGQTDPDCA